ncbi:hypothetical protein [Neobacillus terrae]|uniref:hypothetical protein n=1 Tax=Neobacillus terrae TaxID=3034837 RepID=UPI001407F654|nr:hypothetical protein [Neobacillus terrae]NHM29915.1 hypothetical protein [Neobacillus terrae]
MDLYERLVDIRKISTWEYLLENKITLPTIAELPDKQLDDPSYMAEWLMAAVIRFDNTEAPIPMKIQEIDKLIDNILDKMERDKRKYKIKEISLIPYSPWKIFAIPTPNSEESHAFSAEFEIKVPFAQNDVIELELTPDILLIIINLIRQHISKYFSEYELFMDLFLQYYTSINLAKTKVEKPEIYDEQFRKDQIDNLKKWKLVLREWVVEQSEELFY